MGTSSNTLPRLPGRTSPPSGSTRGRVRRGWRGAKSKSSCPEQGSARRLRRIGDSGFVGARVTSRLVRFLDTAVPPRLGRSFRWLLATSVVNNFGDGVALAAGPLLIASQTRDPFLVSLAVFSSWLPNLLFSVPAGAIADRFDRRKIMAGVNLLRAAVLTVLGLTIVTGAVTIWLVLLSLFLMGIAETFADVAASSLLPRVVPET